MLDFISLLARDRLPKNLQCDDPEDRHGLTSLPLPPDSIPEFLNFCTNSMSIPLKILPGLLSEIASDPGQD